MVCVESYTEKSKSKKVDVRCIEAQLLLDEVGFGRSHENRVQRREESSSEEKKCRSSFCIYYQALNLRPKNTDF